MVPKLSLSMQLSLEAARRELQVMEHDSLLALADRLITQSTMQEVCLRNCLKRIAELEITNALLIADQARQNNESCPEDSGTRRHVTRWIAMAWRRLFWHRSTSGAEGGSTSTGGGDGAVAPSSSDS